MAEPSGIQVDRVKHAWLKSAFTSEVRFVGASNFSDLSIRMYNTDLTSRSKMSGDLTNFAVTAAVTVIATRSASKSAAKVSTFATSEKRLAADPW
jgi:hypothetical protein